MAVLIRKCEVDMDTLTLKEIEIVKMVFNGASNQDLSDYFYVSVKSIEGYKRKIIQKLNIAFITDLFVKSHTIID